MCRKRKFIWPKRESNQLQIIGYNFKTANIGWLDTNYVKQKKAQVCTMKDD